MDKVNIGFDIDGVALRYTDEFNRVFKLFGGKSDLLNVTEFNFFNAINDDERNAIFLAFGYVMQSRLKMHIDFISIMNYMVKELKQPMQFITARQDSLSKNAASESLYEAFRSVYGNVPYHLANHWINVQCVRERGCSKLPYIEDFGMKYFVEDRRRTCLELSKAGIICFMPRRPWNTLPEDTKNIIQYNNSSEIVKYLRNRHS